MKRLAFALCITMSSALAVHAEAVPTPGRHDARIKNATYVDGQVYRVNVGMLRVTSIEFGPGEEVVTVSAGDTAGFMFDGVQGGRAVLIKPTAKGVTTNLAIFTNRRAYYLNLREIGDNADFSVRFGGGIAGQSATASTPRRQIQRTTAFTSYGANVRNDLTPLKVWDDGVFTYFQFTRTAPTPAIFKVQGKTEATVNSTAQADGTIRVSGVAAYWVLRANGTETVVKRMQSK